EFGVDGLGKLYAALVSLMWPIVLLYAFSYMKHEKRQRSFFGFYMMTYGATLGIAFSANLFTMFIFFELLSLSTLPLVTHKQDHESLHAGRVYAAFLFGGAALALTAVIASGLFGETGLFRYGGDLTGSFSVELMRVIFLLGFFGFGMKAAIFPFYKWLPTASCAPTPVTALLHAVAVVNTGVFAVIRLTWYAFGPELLYGSWAQIVCIIVAAFTLLYAAVLAVRERHVKRRLAYSTVSNLSYMIFGIMLLTPEGFLGGLSHLIFHSLTKITLFMCIGSFMHHTGKEYISDINGVGKHMPWTFACYTISALSLLGVPALCGFISKWYLLIAGADAATPASYIGLAALLISAFLCAIYGLSISIRAFFPVPGTDRYAGMKRSKEGGFLMLFPICCFTALEIFFGLFSNPLLYYLEKIAEGLL
ncbi:MAG: proton-conducting membrane transporter, partial [Eubacterium sp.]|nr:proton-conducting membrane transporter [Eubacterium sp.]